MTETELTFFVVPKSEKVPFEGEEERVVAEGHPNEWQWSEEKELSVMLFPSFPSEAATQTQREKSPLTNHILASIEKDLHSNGTLTNELFIGFG